MELKHKNRSFRKVKVKLASRVTTQYKRRKPAHAQCAKCRKELKGVPRGLPVQMNNMPKTKKRPQRPYGGVLCSKCMRETILEKIKA